MREIMTYASALATSRHQMARKNQNSVAFTSSVRVLGPVANAVLLIVLACLIGLLYLMQVTKTNAHGYKLNSLQSKQQELKTQYASLELEAARLQSLEKLKQSDVAKAMTSPVSSSTLAQ
jgi:Tfp pilus assembly protein PilO